MYIHIYIEYIYIYSFETKVYPGNWGQIMSLRFQWPGMCWSKTSCSLAQTSGTDPSRNWYHLAATTGGC